MSTTSIIIIVCNIFSNDIAELFCDLVLINHEEVPSLKPRLLQPYIFTYKRTYTVFPHTWKYTSAMVIKLVTMKSMTKAKKRIPKSV